MALNIPISLNIENLAELNAQVAKMTGAAGGAGAAGAARGPGAIGSLFGGEGGAGGSTAKGLGQIAKQLPGAGMMGDMMGAFKSGGMIGVGMAGVAGILGFVKQIVESSKVFQSIAGSFFKIFGAMADMFLLPFLPLAMRGMQMLMQHLPKFQMWGQKAADWVEDFVNGWSTDGLAETLARKFGPMIYEGINKLEQAMTLGLAKEKDYEYSASANEGRGGVIERQKPEEPEAPEESWLSKWNNNPLDGAGGGTIKAFSKGLYQAVGGHYLSGDQFSPTIKRGDQVAGVGGIEEGVGGIMNSMEVSLASQSEKIKNYATQFQQKEVGSGGAMAKWDDEVLRGSIPETWDTISGMYQKMDDELADEARNAKLLGSNINLPTVGDLGLGKIAEEVSTAINRMTLSDFVLDSSVASEVENCFIIANQCINSSWQSLADLVESGVDAVQVGVGGQVVDLAAVERLVSSAQGMGPAIEAQAAQVAADLATYVYQMSNENVPLTIDPRILSDQIAALQVATRGKVIVVKDAIKDATASVDAIVSSWGSAPGGGSMGIHATNPYSTLGGQFGELGSAFGDATTRAQNKYNEIKNFRWKRKEQVRGTVVYDDDDFDYGDGGSGDEGVEVAPPEPTDTTINVGGPGREGIDSGPAITWDDSPAELTSETFATFGPSEGGFTDRSDPGTPYSDAAMSSDMDTSRSMDYLWDPYGEQFGSAGGGGGRRGVQNTSHSVMNISINTRASVQDILSDLRRVQHMDDASFFNSVS
jgi:hypothetical protein